MTPLNSMQLARASRLQALQMCADANAAHIGSSLSVIDILSVLYSGGARISPQYVSDSDRDYVIVSKGHAAAGVYAVLGVSGFFPLEWLSSYCRNGSELGGHVTSNVPGVEFSTGSLGHGLPFGVGLALSAKRRGLGNRTYAIISDGECDEGSVWESALFAAHHRLGNLAVLIDRNGIQSLAGTEDTLGLEPLGDKWRAFGWEVVEIDGHDHGQISLAIESSQASEDTPTAIVCRTIKGKGVSFMENEVLWHYRSPSIDELAKAIMEVRGVE